jgi:flagellar biosynthesis protein FliR
MTRLLLFGLARALPAVWLAAPLGWPARLLLAGLLTAVAWPALSPTGNWFHELLAGAALGLVASVPFRAAQAAGATLGRAAMGRGDALGDAFGLFALALFAAAGGPTHLARSWAESYVALPAMGTELAIEAGGRLVATSISLALPGLGALLLAELLAGLLGRAQPLLSPVGGGGAGGGLRLAVALLAIVAGISAIVNVLAGAGLASPMRP